MIKLLKGLKRGNPRLMSDSYWHSCSADHATHKVYRFSLRFRADDELSRYVVELDRAGMVELRDLLDKYLARGPAANDGRDERDSLPGGPNACDHGRG